MPPAFVRRGRGSLALADPDEAPQGLARPGAEAGWPGLAFIGGDEHEVALRQLIAGGQGLARIAGTAALELKETGGRYSLSTMCIGVGQGIAIALERA